MNDIKDIDRERESIREEVRRCGNMEELIRRSGLSRGTVYSFKRENEPTNPNGETLAKIRRALADMPKPKSYQVRVRRTNGGAAMFSENATDAITEITEDEMNMLLARRSTNPYKIIAIMVVLAGEAQAGLPERERDIHKMLASVQGMLDPYQVR